MSLKYKIDVLAALKAKGLSTYQLRKQRLLGERVIQQLRDGEPVSWEVLSRLWDLLECDIGDIIRAERDGATGGGNVAGVGGGVDPTNSEEK